MSEPARELLEERVYEHLLGQLAARQYAVGEHLKAAKLADEFDVSRSTVRKALTRLIDNGWVELAPSGRPFIARLPRRSRKPTPHTFGYTNQTEATYWSVFHQILRGGFRPGANVNPQVMADKLGVSLGTVRQALDWLTRDGLLVRLPRRGWQFVSPSWDEVVDTVELRVVLESESLHRACARICPDVLDELEAETTRILESINDVAEWDRRQADYTFHRTLAEQSGSSILTEMLDPLIRRSMFVGVSYPISKPHAARAFLEHRQILHSLRKQDETAALQCLHTHITRWLNAMLSQHDPETLAKIASRDFPSKPEAVDNPRGGLATSTSERNGALSH